ncbi:MAG: phasin family protein [Deltaproteobacteria bacterium]|jgi:polyhydroxyalkanoate synthesis regulator phasin|nr:phasin family protein [Deltaproteobacteria bacterium]
MFEFIKKAIFIGAGLASMTAEKIEEAVEEIVKKGEISEKQGKELIQDLKEKSGKVKKDFGERIDKVVNDTLQKLNIPTRTEVEELRARIEQLEKAAEKKE